MSNFLIILGLILFFFCFFGFIATLVVYLPKAKKKGKMGSLAICGDGLNVGVWSDVLSFWHVDEKRKAHSTFKSICCGVVGYKHYENCSGRAQTRCNLYEKILLKFEGSAYTRDMRFDAHLARKSANEKVCFRFYDRFQYSHLKRSNIVERLAY